MISGSPGCRERSGRRGVTLATEALGSTGIDRAVVLDALVAGHACAGQWEDAVTRIGKALEATTDAAEKRNLEQRAAPYRQKQPWSRISDDQEGEPVPQ